ncbi:MGAT2 [Mytilus edulis]|uniref:Alpha-1,6-mannosyl-glycoprotein 2-beta-N-acetylglucosaminyltransferase n=1 Tax=Mytilus edulis TaxID=6550 RepID=A0A8S3R7A7_MYTED|nr:MGAT2 [Mytilus edulis]
MPTLTSPLDMRFRPVRLIRSLFMIVLILFVFLNLHVLMNFEPNNSDAYDRTLLYKLRHRNNLKAHVQTDRSQLQDSDGPENSSKVEVLILPNQYNQTFVSRHNIPEHNLTQIKLEIDRRNAEQYVHNLQKYGLSLGPESVVIVVQVHDRANYLKILLDSLRKVKGIEKTLLIFSHDVFSEQLNSIVETIDFCPVMQIFFPVSAQLHPKEFPGEHPNDCPRNVKKDQALKIKCNNANHPDKYGHYREAKYCQTKHHWFWKLFHVFDQLTVMKNYTGLVLLLEEDYYVAPDVITILQMMNHLKKKDCKDCRMLTAGNYDKTQSYSINSGKEFCNFDDYNWDWTLQHLKYEVYPR